MHWLLLLPFLLCGCSTLSTAQGIIAEKDLDKRSQKMLAEAQSKTRMQQWAGAISAYDALLERTPDYLDGYFLRAAMHDELAAYAAVEADYETALERAPDYYPWGWYLLAKAELEQNKYNEAEQHLETCLTKITKENQKDKAEALLTSARMANQLYSNPVEFSPTSLGEGINTKGMEYLPSFTADGELLIYTVRYDGQEDFYYSQLDEQGQWAKGQPLDGVNSERNEGAQSISSDGQLLFFTGCGRPGSYGGCDLYYSKFENGKWQTARQPREPLNSKNWDSQPSLSANGRYLYFASDRAGGLGGSDIWRSTRQSNGSWGAPENLGAPINTAADDESPFIHPDGQTLYFMSKGHPGMGGHDLFFTRLDEDDQWQTPENLGYPINTANDEGALVVSLDGKMAYYTTDENTEAGQRANFDIYQFPLHEAARPQPVTFVKGKVFDAATGKTLSGATIQLTVEGSEAPLFQMPTDSEGGFLVVLPAGKNYRLEVDKQDYIFHSERFVLEGEFTREEPFKLRVNLQSFPDGLTGQTLSPIVLKNVLFATGSAELLPASTPDLNRLVQLMNDLPDISVQIHGHTDNVGNDADNLRLSKARAKAVQDYLIDRGIAANRLSHEGFGASRPIKDNSTEKGRQANRRTEFRVVKE